MISMCDDTMFINFHRQRFLEMFLKEFYGHESESSKSKGSYRELKVRTLLCFYILGEHASTATTNIYVSHSVYLICMPASLSYCSLR